MSSKGGQSDLVFRRFGRAHHVRIRDAHDLRQAVELDEALWVATDAPIDGFACDRTFLNLLDSDANGRIMCDELRQAVQWTTEVLTEKADLSAGLDRLRLYAVDTSNPDGHRIVTSARKMLRRLNASDTEEVITLQQVRQIKSQVATQPISEAGVVLASATDDPVVRGLIETVIACTGGTDHPSGQKGAGEADLAGFLAGAKASLEWFARGDVNEGQTTDIMPLGPATPDASEVFQSLEEKLQQFFAQCEAVRYDADLAERIAMHDRVAERDFSDPDEIREFLRDAPIAPATPEAVLRYDVPQNPYYIQRLREFDRVVVEPILGGPRDAISWPEWEHIRRVLKPHVDWQAERPAEAYLAAGRERLAEYMRDEHVDRLRRLIAESADAAFEMGNIRLVEKLMLFQGNLVAIANSFISFPNLYDEKRLALFERGTLVIDGRRLTLSVDVPDRGEHIKLAQAGGMFVIYIEALRGEIRREFCLPVTDGGRGNIVVGKRGVFIDRDHDEWDARVVHVIENPISLGEALMAPFHRIGRLISGKIDALTSEAESKLDATTTTALDAHKADAPAAPAQPRGGLFAGGLLMGGGVAIAAVGSSIAYMAEKFSGMETLDILTGLGIIVGVAVLLVTVPTLISAKLRLRKRDLSAILEGSGWAVNARMRLTRRQSRTFTYRPDFPRGARGVTPRWRIVLAVLLLTAFLVGLGAFLKYGEHSPLRKDEVRSVAPASEADASPQAEVKDDAVSQ